MPAAITTDIRFAAKLLKQGLLVAIPTETVYGLAGDATNPQALAAIFEAKERPLFDPLIVHIAEADAVHRVCREVPPAAPALMSAFWPGPLTLVLPKHASIPYLATSGLETVGVRLPDHELARELIRHAGVPLAAPSANLFGRISPTCAHHVMDQLGDRIACVLDGGPCRVGVESTVLSLADPATPRLLRPGGVPLEEIEAIIGPVQIMTASTADPDAPQAGPGMLTQHYSPTKPMVLIDDLRQFTPTPATGALSFRGVAGSQGYVACEVLSTTGSLREAATNLFAALHRLDASPVQLIVAERVPDEGLGRAINDRLQRAAAKRSEHVV